MDYQSDDSILEDRADNSVTKVHSMVWYIIYKCNISAISSVWRQSKKEQI